MQIKTSDLPGIGKRYTFKTANGDQVTTILHHNGNREIYHFSPDEEDDPDFTLALTDEEARQLGTILLGVDYQPVSDDRVELFLKNIRMEWIKVDSLTLHMFSMKKQPKSSLNDLQNMELIFTSTMDGQMKRPLVEENYFHIMMLYHKNQV